MERYEWKWSPYQGDEVLHYEYLTKDGILFKCVHADLETCQRHCAAWLKRRRYMPNTSQDWLNWDREYNPRLW